MTIYPLRAAYGDALVVESRNEDRTYKIVIDGGPKETEEKIADYYCQLGHINLLVLTHYDEDYIKGVIAFLERLKGNDRIIDRVWANCATIVEYDKDENAAAYEDAYTLAKLLDKLKRDGVIGEWNDDITIEHKPISIGPFFIEVLSPTKEINEELKRRYKDYIEKEGLKDDPDQDEDVSYGRVLHDASKSFDYLAEHFKPTSTTFMNKSSIALKISAEERTILCLADADAKVIEDVLLGKGLSENNPIKVDLVKMSHHGSKANIRKNLFGMIVSQKFLITTNGGTAGAYHPDRQTLACVCQWKHNDAPITFYFNYPLDTIMERTTGLLRNEEWEQMNIVDNYKGYSVPTIEI